MSAGNTAIAYEVARKRFRQRERNNCVRVGSLRVFSVTARVGVVLDSDLQADLPSPLARVAL